MNTFEELVAKAAKAIEHDWVARSTEGMAMRGICYALLALATAVKEQKKSS